MAIAECASVHGAVPGARDQYPLERNRLALVLHNLPQLSLPVSRDRRPGLRWLDRLRVQPATTTAAGLSWRASWDPHGRPPDRAALNVLGAHQRPFNF